PTQRRLQQWADVVRLMVERDGRPLDEVRRVLEFAQAHHFWHRNILSMGTLREKYERLCAEMNAEANGGPRNQAPAYRPARATAKGGADRGRSFGPAEDYDAFVG